MADKIKRYIDMYIATETCNLRCHYCYIQQQRLFNNKLVSFPHSKETIRKALSKKRLGGTCLLNMCAGGETLLSPEVIPVANELLLEGHYVMIVTNGTLTKRFVEISELCADVKRRLFIKFSFHYLELVRLGKLEEFFSNVRLMKESGVSFTVEITPSDELIPHIDDIRKISHRCLGADCHITIARDDRTNGIDILSELDFDEYIKTWSVFDSDLFKYKTTIFYKKRKEFCYAGDWSAYLNLTTGDLRQCYCGKVIDNIYKDIEKPIRFEAIGYGCLIPHCYNGHSFLALGDIPELEAPTYAQLRNRVCDDGSEWLQKDVKEFFSSKLCESNKEYSTIKKKLFEKRTNKKENKTVKRIKKKLRRMFNK